MTLDLRRCRVAFRCHLRRPGTAAMTVFTLAIAIGATAGFFRVIDSAVLKELPYANASRLVLLGASDPRDRGKIELASPSDVAQVARDAGLFTEVAAFVSDANTRYDVANPAAGVSRVQGALVSPNLMGVLGVQPVIGRAPAGGDDRTYNGAAVFLSYELWQSLFQGDAGIVGKTVWISSAPYVVSGVMPGGFAFPVDARLWILPNRPWRGSIVQIGPDLYSGCFAVGRLADGVTAASARARVEDISKLPGSGRARPGMVLSVWPLRRALIGDRARIAILLFGAAGFVLLITCANIGNLLLGRVVLRRHEFAVRAALGASRWDIAWQVFVEGAVLAALGGALGLPLAAWLSSGFASISGLGADMRGNDMDPASVAFVASISLLAAVCFSIAPAVKASGGELTGCLGEGSRAISSGFSARLLDLVAGVELALALTLSIGAGLTAKGVMHLAEKPLGFEPRQLLVATVADLPQDLTRGEPLAAACDQAIARLVVQPNVRRVGVTSALPFSTDQVMVPLTSEGGARPAADGLVSVRYTAVDGTYFEAMGIRLLRGRPFAKSDRGRTQPVAIIDDLLARTLWPGEDAIGKRIAFEGRAGAPAWRSVIGVVVHVNESYEHPPAAGDTAEVYAPIRQSTIPLMSLAFVVRTGKGGVIAFGTFRSVVSAARGLSIVRVESMESRLGIPLGKRRSLMLTLSGFSFLGVVLAAMGVWGTVSHSAAQRRREIGIRLAMGAQRARILAEVLRRSLIMAMAGLAAGLAGALAGAGLLRGLLYDVSPIDPAAFGAVSTGLWLVVLIAAGAPAFRATQVDPIVTLREP